jgi:hypothetical protein
MNGQTRNLHLLPPATGKCQVCAGDHLPEEPHDAQSLYWASKAQAEGKPSPTWSDAIAHCSPGVQQLWADHVWAYVRIKAMTVEKAGPLVRSLALREPLPEDGAAVLGGSGPEPGSAVLGGLEGTKKKMIAILKAVLAERHLPVK